MIRGKSVGIGTCIFEASRCGYFLISWVNDIVLSTISCIATCASDYVFSANYERDALANDYKHVAT